MTRVPFHRPTYGVVEQTAIRDALRTDRLEGGGPNTDQAVTQLAQIIGHDRILLTTSGTHALELAYQSLDISPGDEVVCPSFTFVTVANAVVKRGGKPVFCDVEPTTLNLDPNDLARCLCDRTRAVVPVHYGGVPCDMERLKHVLERRSISIIEDAAHAIGSRYQGQAAGTIGDFGVLSFHHTKNISCGVGGALIVNDESRLPRVTIIHDRGTNRHEFMLGNVDRYTWVDVGSSYLLSDLLAALLSAQIGRLAEITIHRERVWRKYHVALREYDETGRIALCQVPGDLHSNYHTFWFLARDPADRNRLLSRLEARGVDARSHFEPLHTSPFAISTWGPPRKLSVTEDVCTRLIRLPLHAEMSESDADYVVDVLATALKT